MPILNTYLEELKHSLYDSVNLLTGSCFFNRQDFFVQPIGQGKSFADTNMVLPRVLPAPQRFVVRRIWMHIVGASPHDLRRIKECWILELIIGNKIYWQGPACTLILEDELRKTISHLTREKRRNFTKYLDRSLHKGFLQLGGTSPTLIDAQQDFYVTLKCPLGYIVEQSFNVRILLDGTLFRPVC